MAQHGLIGGTDYELSGGKTLISGTAYDIAQGKTLNAGTGYDIEFIKYYTVKISMTEGFSGLGAIGKWSNTAYSGGSQIIIGESTYSSSEDETQSYELKVPAGTSLYVCVYANPSDAIYNGNPNNNSKRNNSSTVITYDGTGVSTVAYSGATTNPTATYAYTATVTADISISTNSTIETRGICLYGEIISL